MTKDQIEALENRPLSLAKAAESLGVSRGKMEKLLLMGEIEYKIIKGKTPLNNIYKISKQSCIDWLNKNHG